MVSEIKQSQSKLDLKKQQQVNEISQPNFMLKKSTGDDQRPSLQLYTESDDEEYDEDGVRIV